MTENLKTIYVDYRFIVKARSEGKALEKVADFLPEANEEIWYTVDRAILQEEKK